MNRNRLCEVSLCVTALAIVVNGVTAQPCEPYWSDEFPSADLDFAVLAICSFDDGTGEGEVPFIGGFFTTGSDVTLNGVAKLDGNRWAALGSGMDGAVWALTGFDDGSGDGPALYAGGGFSTAGGVRVNNIAKWDGATWSPLVSGVDGGAAVRALAVFDDGSGAGPALYAAGFFTTAGGVAANSIAKWDGTSWSPLGAGIDSLVNALAVFDDGSGGGPALYAAGDFTIAGGLTVNRIAKWDGESWSPLGSGVNGDAYPSVLALAVIDDGSRSGPALYAGGRFTTAGGVTVNHVAKWDGESWSPLGDGTDGSVLALMVFDDGSGGGPALCAGGSFETAGGVIVNYIAKWNGSSWSPLGNGLDGSVWALDASDAGSNSDSVLYAGGSFGEYEYGPGRYYAKWDGSAWTGAGNGISSGGSSPTVGALASFDDGSGAGPALYVGGAFASAGDIGVNSIVRWNGHTWSPVGEGGGGEASSLWPVEVWALGLFDDGSGYGPALYAGGIFFTIGGVPANSIAKWDGENWSAVGGGVSGGWGRMVWALAVFDDGSGSGTALYAGGSFTEAGGVSASNIAKWDGATWSALGTGIASDDGPLVLALAVYDDGTGPALYAGGRFTTAGDETAHGIAKWDGATWSPLGKGLSAPYSARAGALSIFDDGSGNGQALYAGGWFTTAGGVEANGIARWDGSSWSDVGGGVDGGLRALAVFDDGSGGGPALYAAGSFTTAGKVSANSIARWDGETWAPLVEGVGGYVPSVWALTVFDDNSGEGPALFAGGEFTTAGGVSSQRIAKWVGCAGPVPGDLDGDGSVGITDLLILLSAWGPCPDPPDSCPADLNGDGTVGILDLLTLLSNWGP